GYNWVHNSAKVIASGDKTANDIFNKFNKTAMTAFPQLSNEEIDAILKYVDEYKAPVAATPAAATGGEQPTESNGWLYTIITLSLLVLVIILWRANQSLRRASNEVEGIQNEKEIPLYRSKLVIAIVAI